jgi:hypothetical protein
MRGSKEISNSQDYIDSRDVIARIDYLKDELESAHCDLVENPGVEPDFEKWLDLQADDDGTSPWGEEAREYKALVELQEEAEGYVADWRHGATLVRDSAFEDHARELAEDIGAIGRDMQWPLMHIDWAAAADALRIDYTSVSFDGVDYWAR